MERRGRDLSPGGGSPGAHYRERSRSPPRDYSPQGRFDRRLTRGREDDGYGRGEYDRRDSYGRLVLVDCVARVH